MALSNRDRLGQALEVFAEAAEPYVDRHMSAASRNIGTDWLDVLAARDEQKHGRRPELSKRDPRLQLRVLTEEWRAFKDSLSRVEQSYASELRDVGNKWAHNDPFTADDTHRALDTLERLLSAMGAVDQAARVRRSRLELQRTAVDEENRKAAKTAAAQVAAGFGLKPWREVIRPHPDVASGNFNAADFAADLFNVAFGSDDVDPDYVDPVQFFRRTYLTDGLCDLITRAVRRVRGDMNAAPVWNLQTNFGGGKSHSMLALYHLFSGRPLAEFPQDLQDLLSGVDLPSVRVRRVVLVGNHIPPSGMTKKDGTRVNTLWGELAWQLGERDAYERVADADRTRTNPGMGLQELIAAHAPCVILVDEWVAYARQLFDGRDDIVGGSFETQFTFAQTLTEAVSAVKGALLVVSIPASHDLDGRVASDEEVGGTYGQQALGRLQQVVGRVADPWRPASQHEAFEIVRRRLFETPGLEASSDITAVAREFVKLYGERRGEFPSECTEADYERRIIAAYPVHPELFERLYADWSTLERFQRTRGVLRLMSKVIYALWVANDPAPLIMPGGVPLDVTGQTGPGVELATYLEDGWKPIIDVDIDGPDATPVRLDRDRTTLGQRAVTRRVARTVFLGSAATLKSAHRGIAQRKIALGVAVPGDSIGHIRDALHLLGGQATYLYTDGDRWWFDRQPNVIRTAKDIAERLRDRPEEVWVQIVERLRRDEPRSPGGFVAVHAAPETDADIPDLPEARLVILHPRLAHGRGEQDSAGYEFADRAFQFRGSAQRINRNMVVFLAPDRKRLEELEDATRQHLAWKDISDRRTELDLSPLQVRQVENRLKQADESVALRIPQTYVWTLLPTQRDPARPAALEEVRTEGATPRLAERTSAKLRQVDQLRTEHAPRAIWQHLTKELTASWTTGHISVGQLWDYYGAYPYLSRLRDRSVLDSAIRRSLEDQNWTVEGFALAQGYDETAGRYMGLAIPGEDAFGQIVDSTLLVRPDVAEAQRREELAARAGAAPIDEKLGEPAGPGPFEVRPDEVPAEPAAPANIRFYGVYRLKNPDLYAKEFAKLGNEIIQHLVADEGVDLTITIDIQAIKRDGFSNDKARLLKENADALRFDDSGIEDA